MRAAPRADGCDESIADSVETVMIARKQLRPPDARIIKALYALGLGRLIGRLILLLTTTGRKSGLPRVTPL